MTYFPRLSPRQQAQFGAMPALYAEWNARINVVSRKDIDSLMLHHVLHSLAIARVQPFLPGARVLDVGTGGGFPGIPLAVMFPETQFVLVDSIGKKIKVVNAVAEALALRNVEARQSRVETLHEQFDFVVSRGVTDLATFVGWVRGRVRPESRHALPNGLLALKGGDLSAEVATFADRVQLTEISSFFHEPFFETKRVLYLPLP